MKIRDLLLRRQKGDSVLAVIFFIIGVGLGVVGFMSGDFLWYIRMGIFWLAAGLVWLRGRIRS